MPAVGVVCFVLQLAIMLTVIVQFIRL